MPSDTQLLIAIIAALSAVGGAAVGSFTAFLGTWLSKRSEERKHLRDLVLQAALENYKADREHARLMTERFPSRSYKLPPLSEYILSMSQLAPLIGRKLSPEQAEREVKQFTELLASVGKHWGSETGASTGSGLESRGSSGD
jgi:hypothetical protein